jgi:tRNA pseudouridine55 synthase
MPRAVGRRPIDGVLLIDKPAGVTSHDAVSAARRVLRTRRVGHAGTLDPFATGLLVLLIGRATRLLPYVDGEPKVYDATISFGVATDTDDHTGTPLEPTGPVEPQRVRAAIAELTGEIDQLPPTFSAKQIGGERAHAAARRGTPLALRPARVTVHDWQVHALSPEFARVTITCGGGTYIRALARDLGRLAGSSAHLTSLRRRRSGAFDVADAATLDELARSGASLLRPAADAMGSIPVHAVDAESARRIARGQPLSAVGESTRVVLVDEQRNVLAIAERVGASWQPRVVLAHD